MTTAAARSHCTKLKKIKKNSCSCWQLSLHAIQHFCFLGDAWFWSPPATQHLQVGNRHFCNFSHLICKTPWLIHVGTLVVSLILLHHECQDFHLAEFMNDMNEWWMMKSRKSCEDPQPQERSRQQKPLQSCKAGPDCVFVIALSVLETVLNLIPNQKKKSISGL